jgi:hypothetical protein
MKILNLDKFASQEKRQLVIAGKSYPVDEMTVENFIETTRAAEKLAGEVSIATQVEATIDMICRSVPTVDRNVLGRMSLPALQTIVVFVRGDDVEGVEIVEEDIKGKAGKAKK